MFINNEVKVDCEFSVYKSWSFISPNVNLLFVSNELNPVVANPLFTNNEVNLHAGKSLLLYINNELPLFV